MGTTSRLIGQEFVSELLAEAVRVCHDWPEFRLAVGEEAQKEAQGTVRKRTETLMKSITITDTGVVVHVGTDLEYAWPVHAGVPKENLAPNRFLLPLAYELDPTPIWERMTAEQLEG